MQLMIDPASPDHDAAMADSAAFHRHKREAIEARQAAHFYAGLDHNVNRIRADALLDQCLANEVKYLILESHALARLNMVLLHSGASVGHEYTVGRSVYRVCNAGHTAAYLGEQIPTDELHQHYEGLDNAADEMAERRSSYEDAIRVGH